MFFFSLFLKYIFPILGPSHPFLVPVPPPPPPFLVILPPCHPGTVLKPNELKQHKLPRSQQIRFRPTKSNFCHQRKENQYHTNNKQWCDWWPKSWLNLEGTCVLVAVVVGWDFLEKNIWCWFALSFGGCFACSIFVYFLETKVVLLVLGGENGMKNGWKDHLCDGVGAFLGSYGVHVVLKMYCCWQCFGKGIRPPKGVGLELCWCWCCSFGFGGGGSLGFTFWAKDCAIREKGRVSQQIDWDHQMIKIKQQKRDYNNIKVTSIYI